LSDGLGVMATAGLNVSDPRGYSTFSQTRRATMIFEGSLA
jgi:hypothetical protein